MTTYSTSNRITLHTAKISALTAAMLLMQSNMALAAPSTLVQTINNIANATYDVDSIEQSGISNQVQVKTSALPEYGINLTQQPLRTVAPNTLVNWVNVLSNTGYSSQTVELTLDVSPTLSNLKVYQDLNNNGEVDSEDRQIMLDNLSAQIKLGQSESIQLIVQALSDAEGEDGDTADVKIGAIILEDPSIAAVEAIDRLVIVEPKINFTTSQLDSTKTTSQIGDNVYIDASYAQCNVNLNEPDEVWITIKSSNRPTGSGDSYTLKAIETGNNTGKYRLSAPTQNNANAINDDIIQTLKGDALIATLDACVDPTADSISSNLSSNIAIIDNSSALKVEKEGDVKTAEFGDYVNYTIKVTNDGKFPAYNVELKDALPRGFDYVDNSVRVSPTSDITINQTQTTEFKADGKYQVLNLGTLTAGETKNITYRVLIGSTALGGDGINRATAYGRDDSNNRLTSREAQWPVEVSRGVMSTDGIIIGKVYHDINRDGIQQKEDGELGVAGVRIYMENGNFIVTDPEGKYNFYGISAKTHVLKVDRTTVPRETELVTQSNRNAGDAGSRFVDLKYGELHRADFAIVGGMADSTERLNAELIARSKLVEAKNDTLEQAVKSELTLEPDYDTDTTDNVNASGCTLNGDLDLGNNCDSAIVNEMVNPVDSVLI
ncbi:SdrD B-like domain-containing protein [Psychrobacter sp. JCM 18901]|uniref:SdrD B-like domain-containing protein n=1 Tax=Psychrobacter sp. JCM 18901 TaxID=1298609 RepID=UPI0021C44D43|nr:SdrD B-like domain-containing protein [Psychrobacter sp. JCM 18901]